MKKVNKEILGNMCTKLLEELEECNNLDNFLVSVENVAIESVVHFSDGVLDFAASILQIKKSSLEKRLVKSFGSSKDFVDFHVLLKRMRERRKIKNSRGLC
ncbi:MAG: hypothetical protein HRT87_02405 [Legionellales bacterium]|nr:hypothetical protein [Legionellales bacterium]